MLNKWCRCYLDRIVRLVSNQDSNWISHIELLRQKNGGKSSGTYIVVLRNARWSRRSGQSRGTRHAIQAGFTLAALESCQKTQTHNGVAHKFHSIIITKACNSVGGKVDCHYRRLPSGPGVPMSPRSPRSPLRPVDPRSPAGPGAPWKDEKRGEE